uniref:MFS transporter n=1 Tax=Prevotella sp. GTC17262 TaxID=3236797 RepID=A0AB33JHA1_9BACT
MDTQNTPIHIGLWHRNFWMLALVGLFLTMSVYVQMVSIPYWGNTYFESSKTIGLAFGIYGIGLFVLGAFCSYLVQAKCRHLVCKESILVVAVLYVLMWLAFRNAALFPHGWFVNVVLGLRFLLGAFFGLAEMVLASTLVIDSCESFYRTEANHSAAWLRRFALSLGPVLGVLVISRFSVVDSFLVSAVLAIVAFVLLSLVRFPFKAPEEDTHVLSCDRFFLPHGLMLHLNFLLTTTGIGLLFCMKQPESFYGMLMGGFLVALLAEKYAFANADLKSENITGALCIVASVLIMYLRHGVMPLWISAFLLGLGVGLVSSRTLLFLIKLSRHCERGTSQSTFFLLWEAGLAMGLFMGFYLFDANQEKVLLVSLGLVMFSLMIYNFFTHSWYVRNKNR